MPAAYAGLLSLLESPLASRHATSQVMPTMAPQAERIRLAIVTTHPIQYYAPIFRALAHSRRLSVRVFYTWSQSSRGGIFDPGFGSNVTWDVPLLEGYDHLFVPNVARH